MFIQKSQLCRLHHDDQEAPRLWRDYLDSYTSPFPQNERYMTEIASTLINIRGSDLVRLRAFGRFLQTYELPEVLTWDAIDRALPESGQFIRSCLFQLGDVLAERGKMQGWESHLSNGGLRRSLQRTPVAFLQTNIQTAVTPEISALVATGKFGQLKRLLARYLTRTFAMGSVLLIGVVLLGRLLILNVLRAEYSSALPVFYLLAIAAWLILAFLVFRPLALSLDLLRWHNLALLVSTGMVVSLILTGKLNALTMAYIQLVEALVLRALFSRLVWTRLKRRESEE